MVKVPRAAAFLTVVVNKPAVVVEDAAVAVVVGSRGMVQRQTSGLAASPQSMVPTSQAADVSVRQ